MAYKQFQAEIKIIMIQLVLTTLFLLGEIRIFSKNVNKAFKCLFFSFCSFIIVCIVKKNSVQQQSTIYNDSILPINIYLKL